MVGGAVVVVAAIPLFRLDEFEQAVVLFQLVLEVGFQIAAGMPPAAHGFDREVVVKAAVAFGWSEPRRSGVGDETFSHGCPEQVIVTRVVVSEEVMLHFHLKSGL